MPVFDRRNALLLTKKTMFTFALKVGREANYRCGSVVNDQTSSLSVLLNGFQHKGRIRSIAYLHTGSAQKNRYIRLGRWQSALTYS